MDVKEARQILGVLPEEDAAAVKTKYRKLMLRYHPDTAGQEDREVLEKAQRINEAFRVLKIRALREAAFAGRQEEPSARKRKNSVYVRQNKAAIRHRTLYMANPLHDEMPPIPVANGRFYWDPDVEEFPQFLMSVNQVSKELLEEFEEKFGYYSRSELPDPPLHDRCQRKLFHLLVQEFIDPQECLPHLSVLDAKHPQVCHVEGAVAFSVGRTKPSAEELRRWTDIAVGDDLQVEIADSRLLVYGADGFCFGHVFFEEDCLYYVVLPLVLQDTATLRVFVKRKLGMDRIASGKAILELDLELTFTGRKHRGQTAAINLEIADLLQKYEKRLRRARL